MALISVVGKFQLSEDVIINGALSESGKSSKNLCVEIFLDSILKNVSKIKKIKIEMLVKCHRE